MTPSLYLLCFALGLLGIIFQTLMKISAMQKQAKLANHAFTISEWFKDDWTTLALNVITVLVSVIAVDELLKLKPAILPYIKWCFFFIGYTGSSILNFALSKTQSKINAIIDVKTNKADGIE